MYHFLIPRFTHKTTTTTTTTLHSTILCRNNVFFNLFNSRFFSVSDTNLVNSCGLSPEKALKLRNPNDPNAVFHLLRNYGFSDSQLSTLVKKCPTVLLSKPEKTLLPKLKFLHSIGVSTTDFPKILIRYPSLLGVSLEKFILPRYYQVIRSLVCNDNNGSMVNDYVPNIKVLMKLGVPQTSISHLVSNYSNVVFTNHSRFVDAVKSVNEMGFNPSKLNFVLALQVFTEMKKEILESKLKIFERLGWSKHICVLAFQRYPPYLLISDEKIMKTMNFLVKDMGVTPEDIARSPDILDRNLEKTIMPRCAVVKILKSRGLIKSSLSISSFITVSEKIFLERYVTPFQKDLPLLLDAFKGQNEIWESKLKIFEKWGWSRDICLLVFQKHPQCILISEKKIIKTMNFLVKDMGLTPEDIATCPSIMNRNLEKTIMPRCAVVKILKSRGLIKSSLSISSFIKMEFSNLCNFAQDKG